MDGNDQQALISLSQNVNLLNEQFKEMRDEIRQLRWRLDRIEPALRLQPGDMQPHERDTDE